MIISPNLFRWLWSDKSSRYQKLGAKWSLQSFLSCVSIQEKLHCAQSTTPTWPNTCSQFRSIDLSVSDPKSCPKSTLQSGSIISEFYICRLVHLDSILDASLYSPKLLESTGLEKFLVWNLIQGAKDFAIAFATSLGANALTLEQVVIIASFVELLEALLSDPAWRVYSCSRSLIPSTSLIDTIPWCPGCCVLWFVQLSGFSPHVFLDACLNFPYDSGLDYRLSARWQ